MGKPKRERSLAANEAKATAKNLRISPQKLNLVAGLIRGKKVDRALADLEFSRKRIAIEVRKCLASAVANAEENHGLDIDNLVVSQAWVGKNLLMRRFAARGRGRSAAIVKAFSEISIIVKEVEEEAKADKKAATKGGKAPKAGESGKSKGAKAQKETA